MPKDRKLPSPCIDVCRFRRGGHCIGCSMTKDQKRLFKTLRRAAHRRAFVLMLTHQQASLGRYAHWREAYARKCRRKNVAPPFT